MYIVFVSVALTSQRIIKDKTHFFFTENAQ